MSVHNDGPSCAGCEKKLLGAHPAIADWYRRRKEQFQDLHIAWAFRNQEEQTQCLIAKKTRLPWPKSKHNRMLPDQTPQSCALDLFGLLNGVSDYSWDYFTKISNASKADGEPVLWGHDFRTHQEDGDHFELIDEVLDHG